MDIIELVKKEIRLNSGIEEENFGKMSYAQILKEEGVLVKGRKTDKGYEFEYEPWSFDDIQAFDDGKKGSGDRESAAPKRKVFYVGKAPFLSKNADTLLDLLDSEKAYDAGVAFMHLLTDSAKQKRDLALIGAGGILIDLDKKKNATILILPQNLFNYSIAGLSDKEKARLNNWWLNPTLKGVQAFRFMRAAIAYKILVGKVPYSATDIVERNADILDEKFLPLEYCINGINLNLSDKIGDELVLNATSVIIPGKKQKKSIAEKIFEDAKDKDGNARPVIPKNDTEKELFFSESYFKSITDFPFDLFKKAALEPPKPSVSDEVFKAKAKDFLKKQAKQVKTKRLIRRNIAKIVTIAVCAFVVAILVGNIIKSNRENPTSKGLTSEQTVEAFFKSMNTLDTTLATNITKGRKASRYADVISQIYVMGKNRQAYEREKGFLNPAGYFLYVISEEQIGKAGIYGATNLKINGSESNIDIEPFAINQKPEPITEENGSILQDKMEKAVRAEYYLLHTEAGEILVERHDDIFILSYSKDKWFITDIQQEIKNVNVNESEFYKKYFALLGKNGGSQLDALDFLKKEYDWLPKQKVIQNEIAAQKAKEEEWMQSYGF